MNGYDLFPTAPKSAKMEELKAKMRKASLHAYSEGINTSLDILVSSIVSAQEKGHLVISLTDLLKLFEELRAMALKNIPKE